MLVIESHCNQGDEQVEYRVEDRLSFMRFLDLEFKGRLSDANTIRTFCEHLTKVGTIESHLQSFDKASRPWTLLRLISEANIGPNRFHQYRTVS